MVKLIYRFSDESSKRDKESIQQLLKLITSSPWEFEHSKTRLHCEVTEKQRGYLIENFPGMLQEVIYVESLSQLAYIEETIGIVNCLYTGDKIKEWSYRGGIVNIIVEDGTLIGEKFPFPLTIPLFSPTNN